MTAKWGHSLRQIGVEKAHPPRLWCLGDLVGGVTHGHWSPMVAPFSGIVHQPASAVGLGGWVWPVARSSFPSAHPQLKVFQHIFAATDVETYVRNQPLNYSYGKSVH